MLQAHSFLWHYLWVAPNVLLLSLGVLIHKRRLHKQVPAFFSFCIVAALGELTLYSADVLPSIPAQTFWRLDWAALLIEGILKLLIIAEIFAHVFGPYASIVRTGKTLIRGVAALVVLLATFAAAYAPRDGTFGIVSGAHFLEQTIYLIECGLLVFIFLFSAYFHLAWDRMTLGITLGLSISACVHLAVWAALANAALPEALRNDLVFVKMAAYHFCVLLWFYYVLSKRKSVQSAVLPPENNLAAWNRELERLLQ